MDRPLVIQTEDLDEEPAAWLAARCRLERCSSDDPRFAELLPHAAALVVRTYTKVDESMLARAAALKVVGRAGVGLENIDEEACRRRGIRVINTPDANTTAVAEYVFALMLDVLRPRMYLGRQIWPSQILSPPDRPARGAPPVPTPDQWHEIRRRYVAKHELNEMTLGIWGMGRVGRAVARIASGFGMRIIYNDLVEVPNGQRWRGEPVSTDTLLQDSDVLSIHVDGRAANRHLVSAAVLAQLKPQILFINTSRGFIVDAASLAAFLRANPAAAAMLDVHDPEPVDPVDPLLAIPNAWLLPHFASGTTCAKRRMSWVVRDVWEALEGAT